MNSRITGGDISVLVEESKVERIGYSELDFSNFGFDQIIYIINIHSEDFEFDKTYSSDEFPDLMKNSLTHIQNLQTALEVEKFYISNVQIAPIKPGYIEVYGDLYKEKEVDKK